MKKSTLLFVVMLYLFPAISYTQWIQLGTDLDGEGESNNYGYTVSTTDDGTTIAIGGYHNNGNGSDAGHARIFEWNGSDWIQRGSDIDGMAAGDRFGYEISLNFTGDIVAIGAKDNDTNGDEAGHTRVFEWNGSAWVQRGQTINGDVEGKESGTSVSLDDSGDVLAIGAPEGTADFPESITRVYDWNGTAWIQRGFDILGETNANGSGNSVSLSSDGNILAVGAPSESTNSFLAGHTRVFGWNGSAWTQQGANMDGEASFDFSGSALALSGDGHTLIVGAFGNDGAASSAGHARVHGGCFDERFVFDHVVNINTTYRARNFVNLHNVTVNPTHDLTVIAQEIVMENDVEVVLGATLCIIPQDGCE